MKHKNISVSYGILFRSALVAFFLGMSFTSHSQTINTFAGIASGAIDQTNEGYSGDGGPATAAELNFPAGLLVDVPGNIYIADYYNNLIRIVNTSGIINTYAGIASGATDGSNEGYSGDGGPATAAELNAPQGIAEDALGNIYIADDYNNLIRIVNTSGIINTFAGNPNYAVIYYGGYSGDGGPATDAELNYPAGIAVDASGNVYIADEVNNLIRIVNTSGTINTFAGNVNYGAILQSGGYSGDGGPATAAELSYPAGVAVDASGNVYIADQGNSLIRIVNTSGIINTFAGIASGAIDENNEGYSGDGGPATAAELYYPAGVTTDASGDVYIADYYNNLIRIVNTSGIINTYAGEYTGSYGYSGDGGPATAAELDSPSGTATDASGSVYIADSYNNLVRIVTPIFTVSGNVTANVSCNGASNGSASVNSYQHGTSPYTYSWSSGAGTTSTASELSAGTYAITVTDHGDSTASTTVIITQPAALFARTLITSNVTCNSGSNGSATANPSNGTAPYTYLWSGNGGTNSTASGLSAGTYTLTIQDSCGASATALVAITQPNTLSTSASVINNTCSGSNTGRAMASPSDGTSPYTYSWSPAGGTGVTGTGLSAGTFTITVQDNCGTSVSASVTITELATLSTTASAITNVSCNGGNNGNASASPSNGSSPYTYSWSPSGGTNFTANGLSAGTYTITVSDQCSNSATASVIITEPSAMSIVRDSASDNGSNTGVASVTVNGGTSPYTYSWAPGAETTDTIKGQSAGTYTCTITDNNSCSQTISITIKSSTGIDNISNLSSVNIYPDPTSGSFTISGVSSGQVVNIYNYLGENISNLVTTNNSNLQLNISNQANGVYLIRILDKDGTMVYEQKIVKAN